MALRSGAAYAAAEFIVHYDQMNRGYRGELRCSRLLLRKLAESSWRTSILRERIETRDGTQRGTHGKL